MTKEELAQKLNGVTDDFINRSCGYKENLHLDKILTEAENNNLVIVYRWKDHRTNLNMIILNGAIRDTYSCYNDLSKDVFFVNEVTKALLYSYDARYSERKTIKVHYDSINDSCSYETDIPHTSFNILKDNKLYCQGIVFSLDI